jgi:ATP-dependent protease ClpP protease subunit
MLVHQLRTWFEGTYTSLKDENKNMDLLTDAIKNFYLTHTKFTDVELTEILQRDMYLNAHECLRFGLIDYII